ncbi:MAG: serine protease [Trichodesmium sp. MAG_R04]|nr:serine protease [Trichodesmium sp. MAG_R04]
MKIKYYILGLTFLSLTLTNCFWSQEKINHSIVKIVNKSGHGTGFFVKGEPGICSVLTVAHVLKKAEKNVIETHDGKEWLIKDLKIHPPGIDLALVTFEPKGKKCDYLALKTGDSYSVRIRDEIYISGHATRGKKNSQTILQTSVGKVSGLGQLPDGYGISYDTLFCLLQ